MHLTPEEKAVGKANFQVAIGSSLTRRKFLSAGIANDVSSGNGLGPMYFGYDSSVSEPIRVGVIGTGDEGSVLIGAINTKFITVKAIADIRPYSRHRAFHGEHYTAGAAKARPGLMAKYHWTSREIAERNVKVYGAYQQLIENASADDLEAVIIALPLHLHAAAAIAAMKAGLHVLTEKLMGHSVRECKEMARVAAETGLHLATGHQRHYNILYDNAVDAINRRLLGDLHYIRAQWHRGNLPGTDNWQQPMPESVKPDDPQAGKLADELDRWKKSLAETRKKLADAEKKLAAAVEQGNDSNRKKYDSERKKYEKEVYSWTNKVAQKEAQISDTLIQREVEKYGYQAKQIKDGGKVVYDRPAIEELIRWRLWNRTGGGLMAELGSHQLDAASIFISAMHGGQKQHPLNVSAAANRPLFPPDRDVDDHVYCLFEFPAPGYNPDPKDAIGHRRKISVAYASINGNGFGGYGETVFGTKGTLVLEREQEAMLFRTHETSGKIKVVRDSQPGRVKIEVDEDDKGDPHSESIGGLATQVAGRGYTEELEHWAWCIRNPDPQNQPHCHPKVALADAVIALTTNIAAREGRRIEFMEEWFDPDRSQTPENPRNDPKKKPDVSRYGA